MHSIFTLFGKIYDWDSVVNQLSLTQAVVPSIPKTNNRTIYNNKHGKFLKLHFSLQQSLKYMQTIVNASVDRYSIL